jgi:two-component system KDP operon response regulator KdpE
MVYKTCHHSVSEKFGDDIIKALDGGANDYLTKPFRSGELIARIRAAIRLSEEKKDTPLMEFGTLSIDRMNHVVRKNGEDN